MYKLIYKTSSFNNNYFSLLLNNNNPKLVSFIFKIFSNNFLTYLMKKIVLLFDNTLIILI